MTAPVTISARTPGHDVHAATADVRDAQHAQQLWTAQRAELHLDITDDAIRNCATHAKYQNTKAGA